MMIIFLLIMNCFIAAAAYMYLYQARYLFSDRFGFILATTGSTISSIVITNHLFYVIPYDYFFVLVFIVAAGLLIGFCYGALVNSQTLIAGIYSGGVGGVMGIMIGAIALDPSICSLPSAYNREQLTLFFSIFGTGLLVLTNLLLCFARKV